MKPRSARSLAYQIVRRFDPQRSHVTEALARELSRTEDRQRCTDLVLGTLRHRQTIDHILATLAGRPVPRISPQLLCVLRVAVYELCYCHQTPPYAIVHEAVEDTKRRGGRKQVAFVNGVLRQIGRQISDRQALISQTDPQTLLVTGPTHGCEFGRPLLPHLGEDPQGYLTTCFSLPAWLVQSWLDTYGFETTRDLCVASNRRPATTLRVNPLQTTDAEFLESLVQYGLSPTLCEPGLIQVRGSGDVTEIPGFAQGHFSIQDRAAYQVVNLMQPTRDETLLDYCAAPGGKTTHLAESTQDRARIYATDKESKRLQRVKENADRLRLKSVITLPWEAVADPAPYDAVLLDVPCSNTGVLAKRVEVRYRLSAKGCVHLQETQLELLGRAADLITAKGYICYSTCSIQPDENDRLIQRFLEKDRRFQLARESLMLPSAGEPDQDGGYVAILVRGSGLPG